MKYPLTKPDNRFMVILCDSQFNISLASVGIPHFEKSRLSQAGAKVSNQPTT